MATVIGNSPAAGISLSNAEVPHLSRQKRMDFFDLANLLDKDGNLQNEMMLFAFAATMLSTIPVLLGNEFDINVGLKRKKRSSEEDSDSSSYVFYDDGHTKYYTYGSSYDNQEYSSNSTAPCNILNPTSNSMGNDPGHQGNNQSKSKNCSTSYSNQVSYKENEVEEDASISDLIKDMFKWSSTKTKNKPILLALLNLALERYNGKTNPADDMIRQSYKNWKTFWEY